MSDTASLGWTPFFQQQLTLEEWDSVVPARVTEQHKSLLEVESDSGVSSLPLLPGMPAITVGDWLLLDADGAFVRLLDRASVFRRKAAGEKSVEQLIAANVDTAFIVCSLNDDFNLNRIERYLSIVNESGSEAVVVLSKADLCDDPDARRAEVQALDAMLMVETVNCLDNDNADRLRGWCDVGKTVVLLGSSGAGKSTLTNTLLGSELQATAGIRETDSKGRHTTTRRSLVAIPGGALLLDTPGMRELQLADHEHGIAATFSDIETLAADCKFGDCQHDEEPGCAVNAAVMAGELDQRRLDNYRKLLREQAMNAASIAERRASDKNLSKYYKKTIRESVNIKKGRT